MSREGRWLLLALVVAAPFLALVFIPGLWRLVFYGGGP
jgi:hypothetical protein